MSESIDQTRPSFIRDSLSASRDGKSSFLLPALVTALVWCLPAATVAQEEEADFESETQYVLGLELDREWAEDQAKLNVPTKALSCNGNNKYCHGTYDELIDWVRFYRNGQIEILPTAQVRAAAGQICSLYQGNKILIQAGETYADRLMNQMTVSKALGERFRLDWATGTSGFCEIKYIIAPY